jgi:hypothetical protein
VAYGGSPGPRPRSRASPPHSHHTHTTGKSDLRFASWSTVSWKRRSCTRSITRVFTSEALGEWASSTRGTVDPRPRPGRCLLFNGPVQGASHSALRQRTCVRCGLRVRRFFNSSGLVKRAVPRPPGTMRGVSGLAPQFPGGGGGRGAKPLLLTTHKPCQVRKKKQSLSYARDHVVIARPSVLTPPWHYRRSLVSKGRFAISINVICVGICSSLPKRRYRVVIDYVGDLLRHRGKAECWLFRGL